MLNKENNVDVPSDSSTVAENVYFVMFHHINRYIAELKIYEIEV